MRFFCFADVDFDQLFAHNPSFRLSIFYSHFQAKSNQQNLGQKEQRIPELRRHHLSLSLSVHHVDCIVLTSTD